MKKARRFMLSLPCVLALLSMNAAFADGAVDISQLNAAITAAADAQTGKAIVTSIGHGLSGYEQRVIICSSANGSMDYSLCMLSMQDGKYVEADIMSRKDGKTMHETDGLIAELTSDETEILNINVMADLLPFALEPFDITELEDVKTLEVGDKTAYVIKRSGGENLYFNEMLQINAATEIYWLDAQGALISGELLFGDEAEFDGISATKVIWELNME